jgi:hypothetical protein
MPRDIPVGNGDLLITFDDKYRSATCTTRRSAATTTPRATSSTSASGPTASSPGSPTTPGRRTSATTHDTLVTEVTLRHEKLGLELVCNDAVDFHEPVYFRRSVVRDLWARPRRAPLLPLRPLDQRATPVGDTANYDPSMSAVVSTRTPATSSSTRCDEGTSAASTTGPSATRRSAAPRAPGATPRTGSSAATPSARARSTPPSGSTSKSPQRRRELSSPAGSPAARATTM